MATGIKEIAKKVGLSYNTISNILNRGMADLYRPETRDQVVRAAQELGYKVNRSAQTMRSQKTKIIGFAATNTLASGQLDNYTIYPFLVGLGQGLGREDYHAALVDLKEITAGDEAALPKILQEHFFDGLVVHFGAPAQLSRWAEELGIPVLWWDSESGKPEAHLTRDERFVSRALTRNLIELGHRKIAFQVGKTGWEKYRRGDFLHYSFAARYQSYEAEMNAAGLLPIPLIGHSPEEQASQLGSEEVTALIVQGEISSTLFQAAQKLGWEIPGDLSIASLDIEARLPRQQVVGGFTYDRFAAGEKAAELLLDWLRSEKKSIPSETFTGEYRPGETIASPRRAS